MPPRLRCSVAFFQRPLEIDQIEACGDIRMSNNCVASQVLRGLDVLKRKARSDYVV